MRFNFSFGGRFRSSVTSIAMIYSLTEIRTKRLIPMRTVSHDGRLNSTRVHCEP